MRLSTHVALAFASSALALLIDTPQGATKGSPLNITWGPDPDEVVFYLSNNNQSYWPVGFANTTDGKTTAFIPTTYTYQTGHIIAFTRDGRGPIGATQEFPVN